MKAAARAGLVCRDEEECAELASKATIMELRRAVFAARELGVNVEMAVFNQLISSAELLIQVLHNVWGPGCEAASFYAKVVEKVLKWMEEEGLLAGPKWPFLAWIYAAERRFGCSILSEEDREPLKRLFEEGAAVAEYLTVKLLVQVAESQRAVLISYDIALKNQGGRP